MRYVLLPFLAFALALNGCNSGNSETAAATEADEENSLGALVIPTGHPKVEGGVVRETETQTTYNPEATIPPQCYTRHESAFNPCMTCHQSYPRGSRPNQMNDGHLQAEYAFSEIGKTNRWRNLFEDRSAAVATIPDQQVVDYIAADNYSTLMEQLRELADWEGPVPAIENLHLGAEAFDELGFAKDGSHWVAFNYKPLPGTFWPTNGSTDDVLIQLPAAFREQSCSGSGGYSRDTYTANLAILEAAIKDLPAISVPPVDEKAFCADLNGDGILGEITSINRPEKYVGNAAAIEVVPMLYPAGTAFVHTVRYVGIDPEGQIVVPARMKEVRYMRKHTFYSEAHLRSLYGNERQDRIEGVLPKYTNRGDNGLDNGFGWMVLGFIEAADGHLRKQTNEEHLSCMGCHTTLGSTIDQTFAFPRKITGARGWGYIDLKGMRDAPNVGGGEGEILRYLKAVGGGDEFRQNDEMREKWFQADGTVDETKVKAADVYELITPSVKRALALNKAYMLIVRDQDFIHGRSATVEPAANLYEFVDPLTAPVLPPEKQYRWDIRLQW